MEYTKGEWKTNRNMMGTWTIFTDDAHIADVDRHFNAHLIASAPDLYEACKSLAYMWREDTPAYHGQLQEAKEKVMKALAKVEGK